jgi:hypothetical protein
MYALPPVLLVIYIISPKEEIIIYLSWDYSKLDYMIGLGGTI